MYYVCVTLLKLNIFPVEIVNGFITKPNPDCDEPLLFNTSVESKVILTSHDDRDCYALSELYNTFVERQLKRYRTKTGNIKLYLM